MKELCKQADVNQNKVFSHNQYYVISREELYYKDNNGWRAITEEERAVYFSGIINFRWSAL